MNYYRHLKKVACSQMSSYFIYYTEASVVCVIIFTIMLFRDMMSVDRQEKQIKYDHALVAFMLYFVCDACWASVIAGVLPKNHFTVLPVTFCNYVLMAAITYTWLRYVMVVEQVKNRDDGVKESLVYEQDGLIVAEIFPEEEFAGNEAYFNELKQKVNQGRPAYKQVARIVLRKEDFVRNTTRKIVRYKNVPQNTKA